MLNEFCSFHRSGQLIRVQTLRKEWFDPEILAPVEPEDGFLDLSRFDTASQTVFFDTQGMLDLHTFLTSARFSLEEAVRFLYSLFSTLAKGAQSQPVIMDPGAIFLDACGSQIRLTRTPLRLECWMKREPDRQRFYELLLDLLPVEIPEVCGLIFCAARRRLDFDQLAAQLERFYQSSFCRFRFLQRPVPPYRARRPVCVMDSLQQDAFMQNRPAFAESPILMEGVKSTGCFALEDTPERKTSHTESLNLALEQPPSAGPTMLIGSPSLARLERDGQSWTLEQEQVQVGRSAECGIRIEDSSVSARHALLICQEGRWYIRDLHSTNGTWLEQKKVVRRMRLKEGMRIRFGTWECIFLE